MYVLGCMASDLSEIISSLILVVFTPLHMRTCRTSWGQKETVKDKCVPYNSLKMDIFSFLDLIIFLTILWVCVCVCAGKRGFSARGAWKSRLSGVSEPDLLPDCAAKPTPSTESLQITVGKTRWASWPECSISHFWDDKFWSALEALCACYEWDRQLTCWWP